MPKLKETSKIDNKIVIIQAKKQFNDEKSEITVAKE